MALIPDFDTVLPRLVAAYETGRLVPFVGSGMSRRTCTDWPGFVSALESAAGVRPGEPLTSDTRREELVQRANSAVRKLKGGRAGAFTAAVRSALVTAGAKRADVPGQTSALARIRWPLALTTNYDNCYAKAFFEERRRLHEESVQLSVVGRGAEDCQRVLNSLSVAGRPLLWALQGYIADLPFAGVASSVTRGLEAELVVGHEEYRRVTYREVHFRRAFAEVFRQRSLLFLGAGLQESYLQELFGEVLETFGPAVRPHYAFIQEDEVDPEFLLARFQIVCIQYKKGQHGEVPRRLNQLADEVSRPRRAPLSWQWGRVQSTTKGHWTGVPDFEVVRGPLPEKTVKGDCLAVSAGGSGDQFFFSGGIWEVLQGWKVARRRMPEKLTLPYLGQFAGLPVYAVRARDENDERSLAQVYKAAYALFEHVAGQYQCIRLQLLATGGMDKSDTESRWKVRSFPERFSFVQIARAWGAWRRKHPKASGRLAVHVVLETLIHDIASGRIDVLELLSCEDMRFFAELVSETGELERRLFQLLPTTPLRAIVDDLQLAQGQWQLSVTPPAGIEAEVLKLDAGTMDRTLESHGVLPGSTIHFHRA